MREPAPRWAAPPRPVQNGHRLTLPSPGASEAVTSADRARVPHAPCLSPARGGARGLVEGFLWLEAAANTCFCSQVSFVETASQGRGRLCSPETLNSTEEPARAPGLLSSWGAGSHPTGPLQSRLPRHGSFPLTFDLSPPGTEAHVQPPAGVSSRPSAPRS